MSDDQQNIAEGLDPDEIGDFPTDDLSYPPEHPLGVDDPTRDERFEDSVEGRSLREEPEVGVAGGDDAVRLLAPNDVLADDEAAAIAEAVEPDHADDLSAEEAAVHVIE